MAHVVDLGGDAYAVRGTRVVKGCSTLRECGIEDGSTIRVLYRLRGGANTGLDIPGPWQCRVCGATRCWPTRKRCYKCDAPRHQLLLFWWSRSWASWSSSTTDADHDSSFEEFVATTSPSSELRERWWAPPGAGVGPGTFAPDIGHWQKGRRWS